MTGFLKRLAQWRSTRPEEHITMEGACVRAARGAAYLDGVDPGWYRQVDPDTLELAHGACCVLGQLHGDFRIGLSRAALLDMSSAPRASLSPVAWGFQCVQHVEASLQDLDYEYLNRAWRAEVVRRQQREEEPAAWLPQASFPQPESRFAEADLR